LLRALAQARILFHDDHGRVQQGREDEEEEEEEEEEEGC